MLVHLFKLYLALILMTVVIFGVIYWNYTSTATINKCEPNYQFDNGQEAHVFEEK